MKNILDLKREKELTYIVPLKKETNEDLSLRFSGKVLVVLHFYYEASVEKYMEYICHIPAYADILFTVATEKVKKRVEDAVKVLPHRCEVILKENRGRDVSALLVAARSRILEYSYFCFLHDKKPREQELKKDTENWIHFLWESMLASEEYVGNLLQRFEQTKELGVLLPPLPVGDYRTRDVWCKNYENVVSLCEELDVKTDLQPEKKPFSLGTVFWAKTEALHKLLCKEWRYEDFDEEPLANDGRLSHAIERCFGYVAQDAGYLTGTVMTEQVAVRLMDFMDEMLDRAFSVMSRELGIGVPSILCNYDELQEEVRQFVVTAEELYIYGAGEKGRECYSFLKKNAIDIKGFLVSGQNAAGELFGKEICSVGKIKLPDAAGVIIAGSFTNRREMISVLKEKQPQVTRIYEWEQ